MRHQGIYAVYLRELALYFYSPLAYIFMGAFLALSTGISFYGLDFYQRQQADLLPFFNLHPWLYTILVPALGMRLWAEEKASQSLKLILSLNLKNHELILGKFLAAWSLIGLTLIFSFPMWISLAYLGEPDHQVIFSSYLGSWLLAGIYLSMAQALSLLARHQINAWLLALITGLLISLLSLEHLLDFIFPWLPDFLGRALEYLSVLLPFSHFTLGLVALADIVFFIISISFWLLMNQLFLTYQKHQGF